jgi:hypothetical protein
MRRYILVDELLLIILAIIKKSKIIINLSSQVKIIKFFILNYYPVRQFRNPEGFENSVYKPNFVIKQIMKLVPLSFLFIRYISRRAAYV